MAKTKTKERGTSIIIGGFTSGKTEYAKLCIAALKNERVIIFDPYNEYKDCEIDDVASAANKHIGYQFKEITETLAANKKWKRVFRITNKTLAVRLIEHGLQNCSIIYEVDAMRNRWSIEKYFPHFFATVCVAVRQKNTDVLIVTNRPEPKIIQNTSQAIIFNNASLPIPVRQLLISDTDNQILSLLPKYSFYAVNKPAQAKQEKRFYIHPIKQIFTINAA